MVYRIPMSNILGEEGNGIYAVAFEIYDLILIISSYSLPLALSKMISARQANREHKNTGRILKVALRFAIISGGAFALILFFGAGVIEHTIYPEVLPSFIVWYPLWSIFDSLTSCIITFLNASCFL